MLPKICNRCFELSGQYRCFLKAFSNGSSVLWGTPSASSVFNFAQNLKLRVNINGCFVTSHSTWSQFMPSLLVTPDQHLWAAAPMLLCSRAMTYRETPSEAVESIFVCFYCTVAVILQVAARLIFSPNYEIMQLKISQVVSTQSFHRFPKIIEPRYVTIFKVCHWIA